MASLILILFEEKDITAHIEKLYIPFNQKFLLIKKNYEILDIYQIGQNGSKIYSHFSFWKNSENFETSIENFYSKRMDLKGHVLHMMFIRVRIFLIIIKKKKLLYIKNKFLFRSNLTFNIGNYFLK